MADLVREIQTTLRTGKVVIGSKRTIKAIVHGKAKVVVMAVNAPDDIRSDIEHYCKLAGVPLIIFRGTSWDLGAICNKPFMVAALAVLDPGESSILEIARGESSAQH